MIDKLESPTSGQEPSARGNGLRSKFVRQWSRLSVRREALYIVRALAEACVLTPWLTAFALFYRPVAMMTVASVTFAVILGVSYLIRGTGALGLGVRMQRAIVLGAILVLSAWGLRHLELASRQWPDLRFLLSTAQALAGFSVLVPASLSILVVAAFLLWRGLRLAQKPIGVLDASAGFQVGIVLFTIFLLLGSPGAKSEINPLIVAFFFCQLLTIGLARIEVLGDQPGERRAQFGGWWLATLILSTSAVILVAGLVLGIVMGVGPEYILQLLQPVLALILIPLSIIAIPILALIGLALEWIINAINIKQLIATFEAPAATSLPMPTPEAGPRSPVAEFAIQVFGYGKGLLVLAAVALIIIAIVWAAGRAQTRRNAPEDEEHESIWSAGRWAERLRRRLEQGLKQITGAANVLARFGAGGLFTAITIRRIYAQMLQLASKRGYPREPARTPYEYMSVLRECFPGHQANIARITEAYVGVHYGELPERSQDLEEIRAAWNQIRESSTTHSLA